MRRTRTSEKASVLVAVLLVAVLGAALCLSALVVSHADSRHADFEAHRTQALYAAQAGLEDFIREAAAMRASSRLDRPFLWYDALAGRTMRDGSWLTKDGVSIAQYDVRVNSVTAAGRWARDLAVTATGWVPSKDSASSVSRTLDAVVRVSVGRSEVFDYVYFINNWGWYYGDTIVAYGNVRGNGQFDGGGYRATLNAIPRFNTLENGDLQGYRDDGGVFAGWNIIGSQNMRGDVNAVWTQGDADAGKCRQEDVGAKKSLHAYQPPIPMPNLTDLTTYEQLARETGAYVKLGGATVVSGVQGDDAGEKPHLYLVGTAAAPIEIHGPVVVRGSVIISGVVKGQGAIYAGGNVYVPKNLTYQSPPATVPADPGEAQMELWLAANDGKDALGLFAREHVVVGNYTSSSWQSYVSSWVNDWRNESEEDAGEDGLPNTKKGRDGVAGTADDDVLEGDDVFTTEHYGTLHEAEGLIPAGKKVGDPISGTGEDIDGDGRYDPRCAMAEFNIPAPIDSAHWAGNAPSSTVTFGSISTNTLTRLDAAFYTNHHIAMLTTATGQDLLMNGCVVSRNESIIYGTSRFILNYDYRLLDEGESHGFYLPKVWRPVEVVFWRAP